jgi:hypothetical protein
MTGATPPPEEPPMEIHKPKPWHNGRAFLKEVGTIVLGVCIALAAEQAVEWAHWRNEVATARTALRAEIAVMDDFYAYRVAIAPCVSRKITDVERAIADVATNRKTGPVDIPLRGMGGLLSDSEWQSERSAQTLTHFPRGELALMSKFYAQAPEMVEWETKEVDALWGLNVLQNENLGPADVAQLRLNLQIVRHHEFLFEVNARRMLALSDRLGISRPAGNPGQVKSFCTLNADEFAKYLEAREPH